MESYFLDWANLLLRWLHVITAIAWIGSSFYFVFLDSSLTPPEDEDLKRRASAASSGPCTAAVLPPGQVQRVAAAAARPPALVLLGELQHLAQRLCAVHGVLPVERQHLPGRQVALMSSATAIVVALGFLVVFWLLYDAICRIFGQRKNGDAIVGALVLVLVCAAWLACHWFAGRAAFLLVGAMIATSMSANVFFWIIPGQRTVVARSRPASRWTRSTASAASSAACTTPTSRCRCCLPC
jgi:uncharacterized membrane protein